MIRNGRFLMVDARTLMASAVIVAVILTSVGVWGVSKAHEVHRLRQQVCAEQLRALTASAFLRDIVANPDPCVAVEVAKR